MFRRQRILEQPDIQIALLNSIDRLPPSERRVAEFVWKNLDRVIDLSSRDVAEAVGVSLGTVVNFCRSIGLSGFSALKLAAARNLGRSQGGRTNTKGYEPYLLRLRDTIDATTRSLDPDELEKAATILANASSVVLFGGGSSGKVCHIAAEMLAHFGKFASSFDLLSTLRAVVNYVTDGTAVIVVSHRGREAKVVETLKQCRLRGGRTICITNSSSNPLALECEVVLQTAVESLGSDSELVIEPVREIQMAVLHLLILRAVGDSGVYRNDVSPFIDGGDI